MSDGSSSEQINAIKQRIVLGWEKLEPLLDRIDPIPIIDRPMFLKELEHPSIVWAVDKIENVLQRLCIQVKNIKDLKRLIIYTLDAESLARSIKNPSYFFLFNHPEIKIALMDPNEPLEYALARELFEPSSWDVEGKTSILSNFESKDSPLAERWNRQILGIHDTLLMTASMGAGNHAVTFDTLLGFRNSMLNIPETMKSPDFRNLRGFFKGKPGILIGAGPSIEAQLPWLRDQQKHAILIAADTMLRPLREAGIYPHIICSIERTPEVQSLLDPGQSHKNTLLLASQVLDPSCFETYQGPNSIYFPNNHWNRWFGFRRSHFGTGHSCMGLAMACISYLECDPILLMGLDLCWSKQGSSHMSKVPYLEEDFYKKSNQLQRDQAILTKNSNGEEVETSHYWTLFRYQFDVWTTEVPSKVYNLSPIGLPFQGAPKKTLAEIDAMKILEKEIKGSTEELLKAMPYEKTADRKRNLDQIQNRMEAAIKDLTTIKNKIEMLDNDKIEDELKKSPHFNNILYPILVSSLTDLKSPHPPAQERSRSAVQQIVPAMIEAIESALPKIENFSASQSEEGFKLY
ncbi:MAG: hypothetical protein COV44_11130 [Deltaproteobacteria bacterium CG11_big_fil_rev_8_21_14_0_20_45_16]|nr:MAG: hypothetical protein COV44_11130 [Deltaproteobacteria bacterium CG11_big_fil_rev_8_21_14_0_20_45_16]